MTGSHRGKLYTCRIYGDSQLFCWSTLFLRLVFNRKKWHAVDMIQCLCATATTVGWSSKYLWSYN